MRVRLIAGLMTALGAGETLPACTAFRVSNGGVVLVGNNEDYHIPSTKLWFVPGEGGAFGHVFVGFGEDDALPQGGMNERGLWFDMFSTPPVETPPSSEKPGFRGNLLSKLMSECATVDDVLRVFEQYNRGFLTRAAIMIADARGDSAVIEPDAIVRGKGRYQVQTNFYQSRTAPDDIRCERFRLATAMLEKAGAGISVDLCRRILAGVHQEGDNPTLYSNICDLKRRVMYLYHFHNFENVVTIDLAAELKKGRRVVEMAPLFPKTVAAVRYARTRAQEMKTAERRVAQVDPALYADYAGVYRAGGSTFTVRQDGNRLMLDADAAGSIEIFPESESRFFIKTFNVQLTFVRGPDGKVIEAVVRDRGRETRAKKTAR